MSVAALKSLAGPGSTIVTATRRLARQIRLVHDQAQVAEGRGAWRPIDALPWDSWLERCWRALRDRDLMNGAALLLSADQERVAWEQAVAGLGDVGAVLMPAQVVREAEAAWRLIQDFGIDTDALARRAGPDTRHFLTAAARFTERCRERGWQSRSALMRRLSQSATHLASLCPHLVLHGFDLLSPGQEALIKALQAAGGRVERPSLSPRRADARVAVLADPDAELRAAAATAARWLADGQMARIGVVLLDLEQRRTRVEDVFDDILTPRRIVPAVGEAQRAFDLSLGLALADWPAVESALLALRLWLAPGASTELGRLLRSPFSGGAASEAGARAGLDAWLRSGGFQELGLRELSTVLEWRPERSRPDCPGLAGHLRGALETIGAPDRQRLPDDWAARVAGFLAALGWPGEQAPDSIEYQTVEKWRQVLDRLAALSALIGPIDGRACVERLTRLAADTIFQPESAAAPIQVLGLQESAGLQFDALWIGGMSHRAWPRPLRPNALLPVALQRQHGVPRTSAAGELEYARHKTGSLAGAADTVIFSWPRQDADEVLRPSSLIAALPAVDIAAPPPSLWAGLQFERADLEALTDYRLPRWPEGQTVPGGTGVIRAQSACPFQAQARYRLDAAPLETPQPGINHLQRGQIAHLALQWLWQAWRSRDGLAALDVEQRTAQVRAAVTRAARQALRRPLRMDARLVALECERLTERIAELLEGDARRAPFEAESIEADADLTLAGLRLRIRADRVDRLADGGLLVVDYKTGAASVGDWLGRRPAEPQLPLYALNAGERVTGIAYGVLAAGQVGYVGLARDAVEATAIEAPAANRTARAAGLDAWDKLSAAWEESLTEIAAAFADGDAGVRPRRIGNDCRYCHLAVLCRRHELSRQGVRIDA